MLNGILSNSTQQVLSQCNMMWLLHCVHADRLQHIPYIAAEWQSRLWPGWGWSNVGSFMATSTGV